MSIDDLLADRPAVFALGEPTHGIKAFPLLRNDILSHLVERGYRSIALETDLFAAALVNDYVCGATADLDTVLSTGFSHGFGAIPGNRELVMWLREHNTDRAPADQVHFHGFDAPTEYAAAPGPRSFLTWVIDYLPAGLRPEVGDLDALAGDEADWTNEAAMYDPAASIGASDRARALRVVADDVASALHRAGPAAADPAAAAHARTAVGLLRYHAAMASRSPDRMALLISQRAAMMADNLLAIVAQEQQRGPTMAFAHNSHLNHGPTGTWANAGQLVALSLGSRYVFVATDASLRPEPGTLQHELAAATTGRTLFPTPALRAKLPESIGTSAPIVPGHIPLTPADLPGTEAVIFITDTDGQRHQYW